MDRAVRIAVSLTSAIQIILKEPNINTGRHGQALEKLAKIFETATDKLETRHEHRVKTSSTPTTKSNIRTAPRVHSRVTRNNTPGIIPPQNAIPIAITEGGKEFPPPAPISKGRQNSEGGHKSVRKITNKPRSSKERRKTKQRIHSPVERVAQPVIARETRQEHRELTKEVQEKHAARGAPPTTQVEPHFIDESFQPGRKAERSPIPTFQTPHIISQEALIDFSLADVGI